MFLKHHDVKQKNWRMRKVKKVFVSSCMLLTVGLGVAVPTAFSQSNGVMVVKAAETEELPDNLIDFKGTWKVVAPGSSGRFYSDSATGQYKFHLVPADKVEKAGWHEHNGVKDSYVKITKDSIAARYTTSTKAPYSVAFKINTKSLIKDHDYKITFEQGDISSGITVDYGIGSPFSKDVKDSFNISDESKYASKVEIEGEKKGFINRKPGAKTISFRTLKEGPMSLVLLSKVVSKPQGNLDVEFKNFKIIDVTNPSQLEKGVAYVGNKNVELTLKSDDGRTNFEGDEISLFKPNGDLLKTVTVTKDQQNPISITLTEEEAKALKNKEQLKVSIKQKQSKKTSKDFYLEVGIDPEVKAKQKEKLLELDKVKKQIEDLINGDAWLPEKPEGEKPVQNTNKELQLQELNKKYQMAKEAIESATTLEKVTEKYNEYTFEGEKEKYPNSLRNQYTKGNREKEISNAEISLNTLKEKFIQKISDDPWLSDEVKQKQKDALLKLSEKVNKSINSSNDLKSLREIMKNASSEGQNHPDSIPDQYVPGKEQEVKTAEKAKLQPLYEKVIADIEKDPWLTKEQKESQKEKVKEAFNKAKTFINDAPSLAAINEGIKDYTLDESLKVEKTKPDSIPNQYAKGNKQQNIDEAIKKLKKAHEDTKQAIEQDPWLSPEQKKAQKENAKARLDAGLKAVETTESLDKLKEVESDFLKKEKAESIPSQHQAGTPEVARKTFLDNFEKEAKKEIESIDKDDTLTANAKQVAKDKVAQQLQEATAKVEKAQSFDDLKKVETEFVTALPHTKGEKLNQQQTEAISGLEGVQKATEKAISEDKTLSKDEKKKQIADSKERLKSDTQKVKDAKNADAIKKAFEEGKVDIPQAHIPGDLNKDKEKLLAELKQKADDTEKAIDSDKTLTAKEKEEQKAKTKEELQKATEVVGAIDNREELDKKVPELKKAIEDTHVKGNLEGVKNKAIEDLKKVHDETVAKINGDDTLDKATKEAQVKEADKALAVGKEAITKADDADKVSTAVTEHTPKIKAAHKTGDLKKAQEEANTALDKAAEKEREEINNDITLTAKDKEQQLKEVETALTKAKDNVKAAKTADAINDARDKGVATIDAVHKAGQDLGTRKSGQVAKLEEAAKETKDKISADPTLTSKEKEEQSKAVDAELKKAIEAVNAADTADKVDDALGKGVTDIKNQHKTGDPVVARREAHGKQLDRVAQETKDAIEKDPTLTTEEKAKQVKDVDAAKERGMAKLTEAKNADELDKAYGEGVTDIKNQHKSGDPIEARRGLHNKSIDEVAQATKDAITADTTLTEAEKETQRGNVDKEATKAKEELAKAKDADALDKAYGDGVTAIENAHVIGKGIEARKDLAKKDLAEAAAKTKALIIEDKTLTDDQRKEQLLGVDTEYAKGIENIDAAKDAAGVDKAYSDGVRDILAQYKEGQNLNDRRNAAKEFLLKEADKVTKLINDDPTLTHDQKVDQINKVEQAKLDAIKSVDDAQTADAINDALGKGIENINNQYQHGDGVDVRKATAKGDLEKEAAKVKALIAKDPTLTQADKDKQTAAVDAAKNTAIAAVDKATTADGVNQELGKGITAINKAYRPGEAVKARKEAAKADLEKEAAKVKALIAKDPTLTQADKDKQTAAVDAAKNTAIAAVDKATTAEGINQELGKGITAINKAYRSGEGVKARKEAAKADLEKEAAKVKALITNDPTLTKADKAKQTEAVAKALKAAIAAVDKATTAEGINQELGKGITAINKAYRPGEGVKARKEAAKANLEKVAKETKALISGDRYLSETEKAVQKQAVEQALAKALGQVEAAKTVEAVKLAENLGTVAIRSAYVAGLAKDTDQATAALNEAKQAAIEALKQAAAETLAKITTDAKLTEAQKAEQSENVSLALKTAIATVRSAQSIASVKEAIDKGITAIRAAYVPNKAVAKSSSANHLPKSGDANSIVLVGLGVMSLLLGMVLYSKKKESKD
ncbi:LPXTG cell wall anchor domain-containing protein [Streptococcus pyogenes]|uniref:LPXTG cell wall anchor domain-containing protein n=1 Tax=Streptococcus pyogenes TaxID=1314 RepID=UPI000971CEAE|nr:Extracellular Protein Factor, epf [Streptococcus pyogenes]